MALLLVTVASGVACGGAAELDEAPPQRLALDWSSAVTDPIGLDVASLTIMRGRWEVRASLANRTDRAYAIGKPHALEGTETGLLVLKSGATDEVARAAAEQRIRPQLVADSFVPSLPRVLRPGARWRGRFGGRGVPPRGAFVRVVVGRFSSYEESGRLPGRFLLISDQVARLD